MSETSSTSSPSQSVGIFSKFKTYYRKNLWLRLLLLALAVGSYVAIRAFVFGSSGFRNADYEFCAPAIVIPPDANTLDSIRLGRGSSSTITFSPDQKKFAVASSIGIWVYDVTDMQHPRLLSGHICSIAAIAWSPDSQRLASASWDKTARIWNIDSGQSVHILNGHTDYVEDVDWSPDGSKIATGAWDKTVRIWDSTNGKELRVLVGHTDKVQAVHWSPDSQYLASSSDDATLKVWNGDDGGLRYSVPMPPFGAWTLAWSSDGAQLAAGNLNGIIHIVDAVTGQQVHQLGADHGGDLYSLAWSPDNSQIAASTRGSLLKIWDVPREQPIRSFEVQTGAVTDIVWSFDGQQITSASQDHTIRIWDVASGDEIQRTDLAGYTDSVGSIDWSPDSAKIAVAQQAGVRIWNVADQSEGRMLTDTATKIDQSVKNVKWMSNGDEISGVDSYCKNIRIWNALNGVLARSLSNLEFFANTTAWSPDGNSLALLRSTFETRIQILDIASYTAITLTNDTNWTSPGSGLYPSARGVAWSPDGIYLAQGDPVGKIRIWDVANSQALRVIDSGAGSVTSLAWSPDGQRLVSGHDNFTAQVWEVTSGKHLNTLAGHTRWVLSVDWSSDGKYIATGGDDMTVRVWDAMQGKELYFLLGHVDGVNTVKWSPDSRQLASGSGDGTVRVWQIPGVQ